MEKFRFWCQKVLPLVYDDSLSYYELLCKVVDYLNKLGEIVNNVSDEIANINKFIEENTEKVVLETMEKWLDDGTLEGIFQKALNNFTKHNSNSYSTFVDTKLVIKSKISDVAQGFCTDGSAFYMVHHASDSAPLKLMKLNMSGAVQFDKTITDATSGATVACHGNSLAYYGGKLICPYAGDDSVNQNLLVIDPITAKCSTVSTQQRVTSIDFFSVGGHDYATSMWSGSQCIVNSWIKNGSLIPYNRYMQKDSMPNLKQGMCCSDTHVYMGYSGNGQYPYNVVRVYTHALENTMNVFFNQFNDCEMEDLARVSGEEKMYWNDINGNIYEFDTEGLFTQAWEITSFENYAQSLPNYVVRFLSTKVENNEVHTSNGVTVMTKFYVPFNMHRTWSMTGYGYLHVLDNDCPIVIIATTGDITINCTSDIWNGTKYRPVTVRMRYKYDEATSSYTLTYFLMSCHDTPEYVYDSNATTDAKLQVITKWIHERFSTISKLTDNGYAMFTTTLNPGATTPAKLF